MVYSESEIVHELEAGNEVCLNMLFDNYYRSLCVYAFRFVPDADDVEDIVQDTDFFMDILLTVCQHPNVKRMMIVPNCEREGVFDRIRTSLRSVDDENKHITVFAMQPLVGGNFRQEILGYSLMNALGIKSEEIK